MSAELARDYQRTATVTATPAATGTGMMTTSIRRPEQLLEPYIFSMITR